MKGETHAERWKSRGKLALMTIGAFAVLRFVATITHPTYVVKLTLEDLSVDSQREPIAYLEKTWLFSETRFPLRFQMENRLNDWQYEKDGAWHSLLMTEIGNQIDVNSEPDDSDEYRE